ncbi:MAG TPA: energy transducer TonB [Candidatus Acidoferrales bacterium]|nr:energy transducer TonB [Candidatus Acidoferrales bacterium]
MYPQIATVAHVQGVVVLHVIIGTDGKVREVQYVSGPPLLRKAAMDAVKQWRYKPTLLNGQPVEVDTTVTVVFALGVGGPAAKVKVDDSISSSNVYINRTAEFTLIMPDGWTTNDALADIPYGVGGLGARDASADIVIERVPTKEKPMAFERSVDAHGASNFAGYQKISESGMIVEGKTCPVLVFRANDSRIPSDAAGQPGIRRTLVFVPSGKNLIVLMFIALESRGDSEYAVFEKIAESFHSTEGGKRPK